MDVVVLDDHRMVAQSIAGVFSEVAGLHVLPICTTVAEACAQIRVSPPHLLVLDVDLGGERYQDAADLLLQLEPMAELLFITALGRRFSPPTHLAAHTIAVIDKAEAWEAVLAVMQRWWASQLERGLPGRLGCELQLRAIDGLTPREQRVILELGCGLLNKEIAARLDIKLSTVETYRKSAAAKLGVSGAELVRLATLYRALRWGD